MSKKPIRKAVIPAAGLGTRLLPATKSVPKELLPIVDTPVIQIIVEELHSSGIKELVLITGKGKSSIEDHFDLNLELQKKLESEGKTELAHELNQQASLMKIISVRQQIPKGLGHAVLCAKEVVGDEPFVVCLGDDLVDSEVPCVKQMIDVYNKYGKSVIGLMEVSDDDVSKFGNCSGKMLDERTMEIEKMIEKPKPSETPSRLAIVGRYILTPRIFELLEKQEPGKGGEIQITDALVKLMNEEGCIGYKFEGAWYTAGDKLTFLTANIAYAMKDKELAKKLKPFMKDVLEKNS